MYRLGKGDVIRGNASAGSEWQKCWMGVNRINGYIPMRWIITNSATSDGRLRCTRIMQVTAVSYNCSGITTP
jgi:hypothetical protein